VKRREFITLLGGAAVSWPLGARGQQLRARVIGLLWPGTIPPASPRMESLRQGLREAGMIEGRDFLIELRNAQGGLQQLPDVAAELVRMKVDVILTAGDFALRIAQQATSTIPIVANSDDMLGTGLIRSLARPGGNTTGLTILSPELSAKRLQLLRDFMPALIRVASLWDPTAGTSQVTQTESAARSMQIKLQVLEVRRGEDLVAVFETARQERAEALNVFASPFLASLYREIIDLSSRHRLPAIYQWKEHAQAGGLISYGPSLAGMWRQTGQIVAKVVRGANPAELPVEQPTKFDFVINLKTAKALGLSVPDTLLARADEVFE
jgi:putative tryptophan/tyrosine transport system substrate-binding protein